MDANSQCHSCDCLAGGGQDAREVALVGAGTDDQFDPLTLRMQEGGELEVCSMHGSEGHKGGGHFGPIHALAFSIEATWCVSGSEDGNVRVRELLAPSEASLAMQVPAQSGLQPTS